MAPAPPDELPAPGELVLDSEDSELALERGDASSKPFVRKMVSGRRRGDGRTDSHLPRDERLVQGTMLGLQKLGGASILQLSQKYQLNPTTVRSRIEDAKAAGLLDHYTDAALEGLVPRALAIYEAELDRGSLEAARDLLFGLGILSKDGRPTALQALARPTAEGEEEITSLTLYRKRRREAMKVVGATALANAQLGE